MIITFVTGENVCVCVCACVINKLPIKNKFLILELLFFYFPHEIPKIKAGELDETLDYSQKCFQTSYT